jgi:HK97 family phage prohead protease
MKTKRMTCRAFIKSVDEQERTVEQIVSVFGNVDYGNDRVVAGAFKSSLDRWAASGDPIPAIWSHTWDDPFAHIGAVLEARELPAGDPLLPTEIAELGGLYTKYKVDDLPFANQVFHLLKERRVREASFAYDVLKERKASDGANDLLELDLIEVGPTLKGMNPMTQLLARKSLEAAAQKAGITPEQFTAALTEAFQPGEKADTLPHTFIPNDEDRCTICGLTRNTVGHLNFLERDAGGEKAEVYVEGSIESVLEEVWGATFDWAAANNVGNGGFYCVHLEATFPNETPVRAIVLVEGWNDPWGEGEYYEATLAPAPEGGGLVVEGDPTPVDIAGVVVPKASSSRRKARLRGIASTDGSPLKAIWSGTVGRNDDVKSKGKAEDPQGNAEDPEARNESVTTGEAARALVEADALSLTD